MRIRQIRPEFFTDPVTGRLPAAVQVTYVGLWCVADDAGWLEWDVEQIGALLYPYKSGHGRRRLIDDAGEALAAAGKLRRYKCGCALIPTLVDHQKLGGNRSYAIRDKHAKHRVQTSLDESDGKVGYEKVGVGTREADASGAASLGDRLVAAGVKPELVK